MKSNIKHSMLATLPLAISVIPWGILCGTLAIEAGLNSFQAQLMSLIVFAGAAQLSGITIISTGGTWSALLNSTTLISVRHVLYSATWQADVIDLPLYKKIPFAFLLTDEMFAIAQAEQIKTGKFDYWYAMTSGFMFYVVWNIATFIGIFFANLLPNIDKLGFDFAIVATFIAMVVPMIKDKVMLIAVSVSVLVALGFASIASEHGLMVSAVAGMIIGSLLSRKQVKTLTNNTDTQVNNYDNKDEL